MKKIIVTTTIHSPTKAILEFCKKADWNFIIVGDLKTPHKDYEQLMLIYPNLTYLSPSKQEQKYKELSNAIGWNCIQRRNIGFIEAYNQGADIIASVDDDNIPLDNWGKNIVVGKEIEIDTYIPKGNVFDPLSITKDNYLWHRGFPIQCLKEKNILMKKIIKRKVLVQADLWNGDPDIDAIARLTFKPEVNYDYIKSFYCSNVISPFNSQNTFIAREAIPFYACLPFIGRMDDIWGAYILQYYFPNSVIYGCPTVYQERNVQDLVTNLEKEIIGYRNTNNLLLELDNFLNYLPEQTKLFWGIYRKEYDKIK